MYLTLLMLLVMLICVAMVFNEGLWGAALMLFNVLFAALLATNLYEPLANWMNSLGANMAYLWDFVAVWLVFAVSLTILRLITGMLSRHKVRFKSLVDRIGGVFFAAWIGWVMIQFALFTLHMAPLGRNFLAGDFQPEPESYMFFGLGPDRSWLSLMHAMSKDGSLSREAPEGNPDANTFDPRGDFILKYAARRKKLEREPSVLVDQKRSGEP